MNYKEHRFLLLGVMENTNRATIWKLGGTTRTLILKMNSCSGAHPPLYILKENKNKQK